jgi:integrase
MARSKRSAALETRTARLKLPIRRKPFFVTIAPGIALGYRRNKVAGAWVVRAADGHGGSWTKAFAIADDHEEANGNQVLGFWEAQDRARTVARKGAGGDRPATVAEALANYEADLRAREGDPGNVARIRHQLPASLAAKTVALLGARELRLWRDGLVKKGLKPAAADRTARAFKAALNLAAGDDARVTNSAAWRSGLKRLPDAETARNVIISEDVVRELVGAAYAADLAFGLFVEVAAVTGARSSQLLRLQVADLKDDPVAPSLSMPSSRKGRNRKIERRPVPVSPSLAVALRLASGDHPAEAPLLGRFSRPDHLFRGVVKRAGLNPTITLYAFRHSSIVRALIANVPVRVVAVNHDTSVAMIEANYSRYIADHSDAVSRRAVLDISRPAGANVVPLGRRG